MRFWLCVLVVVVAFGAFGWFVLSDGGSVIFTLIMSWFASLALEPAVRRLSGRMRRGTATVLVMAGVAAFVAGLLVGRAVLSGRVAFGEFGGDELGVDALGFFEGYGGLGFGASGQGLSPATVGVGDDVTVSFWFNGCLVDFVGVTLAIIQVGLHVGCCC